MKSAAQTEDTGVDLQRSGGPVDREEWLRETRDGVEYRIRPIRADALERNRILINGLGASSRYDRMMSLLPDHAPHLLDSLVRVDYRREMTFVGIVREGQNESIIAAARYGGNPAYCEFTVAVADEWRSRGVGTTLSEVLFSYAKSHGVRRMYGVMLARNERMLKLADALRMSVRKSSDDNSIVEAWRTL